MENPVNGITSDPGLEALTRQIEEARDLVAQNRTDEAIGAFTALVEQRPDMTELTAVLCSLLMAARRSDVKPEWIVGALAHRPAMAETFHAEALRLHDEGDLRGASRYLEGLALVAKCEAGILNDLGVVRLELGDTAGAETAFRGALEIEPDHADAQEGLSVVLAETGGTEDAPAVPATGRPDESLVPVAEVPASPAEPHVDDPSVTVTVTPRVSRGAVREFTVDISTDGPEGDFVLSMDVYPEIDPGHPDRHHGYWNLPIALSRTGPTTIRVAWDRDARMVTFDGETATDTWHGPLRDPGEYVVTFVVFDRDGRPIARDHIRQHVGPPRLKSAIWFLTWRCNLRCDYCWEVQRIARGEIEPEPFRPHEDWVTAWNRLLPGMLDITGGEPFLQPNFLEMLEAFDDRICIAITTNLSKEMTSFVQRISPEKVVSMTLSLHPGQKLKFEQFLGRALMLKHRGFNLTVNYVAYPEQLWLIPSYKELVEREGLRFHVDPYAATPHFPYEFSEEEKSFLREHVGGDRASHWFGEVDKTPVLCSGGFEHVNVMPGGEAFRCIGDKVWNRPSFGNIFDEDFALNADWTRCGDYWRCPACDKDKIQVERINGAGRN
jgi:MoaA/NifB/PqqE/SkfB family radical SAM enzyme